MNATRIIGVLLLLAGLLLAYFYSKNGFEFVSGAMMGAGVIFLIVGRVNFFEK